MKTILSIIFSLVSCAVLADGFILGSLAEANKLAESTGKPVLLILGTKSCPHCEFLKNDLLKSKISSADKFIICYLGLDKNKDLKKQYSVSMIPDSRILKNNKEISSIEGYNRTKYEKWLQDAK